MKPFEFDKDITEALRYTANRLEIPDFVIPGKEQVEASPRWEQERQKNGRNSMTRPLWKRKGILGAASLVMVVLLGVSTLTYFSPVFAAYVKSLFQLERHDQGLQKAASQGFSQMYQQEVTDQNLTIAIREIIADQTQVAVAYQIKDAETGKLLSPDLLHSQPKHGINDIYLADAEGHQVTSGYGGGSSTEQSVGFVSFQMTPELLRKAPLVLHMDIVQLGAAAGSWKIEVPISFSKTVAATKQTTLEESYLSPDGLLLQMNRVVFTPTKTRIEFQSVWTDESKVKREKESRQLVGMTQNPTYAPYLPYQHYEPEFHLEDNKGVQMGSGLLNRIESYDRYGHFLWNLDFSPLERKGEYLLVLDAVHRTEPVNLQFAVDPLQLLKEPVIRKLGDSVLSIQSVQMATDFHKEPAVEIMVEVLSKDLSDIYESWWMVRDQKGNVYPVTGYSRETLDKNPNGTIRRVYKLYLPKMRSIPEKLDIDLQAVTKRYPVDPWKIPIVPGQ